MATVTGLTKERMLEIEAASVVSGTIDASGHLILTTHDGTQIDAGYALVAVPDASDTQKGVVELATDAETVAHTDTTRSVTPASLASTIGRIDTLEAKPGDKVQIITAPAENETGTAYPTGISVMYVSAGSGWSLNNGFGSIMTVQLSPNRLYQSFTSVEGGATSVVQTWVRTYHDPEGWTSWAQTPNSSDPSSFGMTGEIKMWPGATVPSGWQVCDGAAISRTTFAKLFAILSTTYGAGDGSTTFNVPDMRGRVPTGYDAGQTEFNATGKVGGAKTHVLTQAQMPSHTHTQNPHTHTLAGNGGLTDGTTSGVMYQVAQSAFYGFYTSQPSSTTPTNQNTGGGGAHNNLQPYITMRYIIKL